MGFSLFRCLNDQEVADLASLLVTIHNFHLVLLMIVRFGLSINQVSSIFYRSTQNSLGPRILSLSFSQINLQRQFPPMSRPLLGLLSSHLSMYFSFAYGLWNDLFNVTGKTWVALLQWRSCRLSLGFWEEQ